MTKMKIERKKHVSVTVFVCEMCGKGFTSPLAYKAHIKNKQVPLTEFFKGVK